MKQERERKGRARGTTARQGKGPWRVGAAAVDAGAVAQVRADWVCRGRSICSLGIKTTLPPRMPRFYVCIEKRTVLKDEML